MAIDPADLPPKLRAALAGHEHDEARAAICRTWATGLRLDEERAGESPLQPGCLGRLLGKKPAAPQLPVTASKYGGVPYLEQAYPADSDGNPLRFVGQLNFAELACGDGDVPERGIFVLFVTVPERGIFVLFVTGPEQFMDEPLHWFWYPNAPGPDGAPPPAHEPAPPCVLPYEERISATPAPSFDWDAFDAAMPPRQWTTVHDRVCDWESDHGANCGVPWPNGLSDLGGPRHWIGTAPPAAERPTVLWTPADGYLAGSMQLSLLAPPGALRAGDLSALYVLLWQ